MFRHNLDVMHVEKYIFDSVIGTIMNIKDKTKNSLSTHLDLKEMGIQHTLHPIEVYLLRLAIHCQMMRKGPYAYG